MRAHSRGAFLTNVALAAATSWDRTNSSANRQRDLEPVRDRGLIRGQEPARRRSEDITANKLIFGLRKPDHWELVRVSEVKEGEVAGCRREPYIAQLDPVEVVRDPS